jgi:hypothetical protein
MIIGLTGYSGSGKDTIAQLLCDNYDFTRFAFADPLKEMLIKAGLATREELYITKPPHVRELMQKIGTDIFRNQVDENYWVIKMIRKLKAFFNERVPNANVVIPDVRFANEATMVLYGFRGTRNIGGVIINVIRDSVTKASHSSEVEHETIKADHVFTNNSCMIDAAIRLPYYMEAIRMSLSKDNLF